MFNPNTLGHLVIGRGKPLQFTNHRLAWVELLLRPLLKHNNAPAFFFFFFGFLFFFSVSILLFVSNVIVIFIFIFNVIKIYCPKMSIRIRFLPCNTEFCGA